MKSLQKYSKEIQEANPGQLVEILREMTVDYAGVCEMLLPLEHARMKLTR